MNKCDFCIQSVNGKCSIEHTSYRITYCRSAIDILIKAISKMKLDVKKPIKEQDDE